MEEQISNRDLLERIKQNEEAAFEKLFRTYFNRLFGFAKKILQDEGLAQDIVQEVYIKFWEKRHEIRPINLEAYLFRLVRNQCISHIRHLKVIDNTKRDFSAIKNSEELYRIDFVRDEPYVIIEKELEQEIEKVINTLPDRCREVFTLSRVKGLKNREIAEELGMNVKNVEKHITKALTVFRDRFDDRIPLAIIILLLQHMK